jgi:hypothetical protein
LWSLALHLKALKISLSVHAAILTPPKKVIFLKSFPQPVTTPNSDRTSLPKLKTLEPVVSTKEYKSVVFLQINLIIKLGKGKTPHTILCFTSKLGNFKKNKPSSNVKIQLHKSETTHYQQP